MKLCHIHTDRMELVERYTVQGSKLETEVLLNETEHTCGSDIQFFYTLIVWENRKKLSCPWPSITT
jgi:hypothetical protein